MGQTREVPTHNPGANEVIQQLQSRLENVRFDYSQTLKRCLDMVEKGEVQH